MAAQLNEFQRSTLERLQRVLMTNGHELALEIRDGPEECHAVVKAANLQFWIYPDGANVHGDNVDKRLEIYDFNSLDELQESYITLLNALTQGNRADQPKA